MVVCSGWRLAVRTPSGPPSKAPCLQPATCFARAACQRRNGPRNGFAAAAAEHHDGGVIQKASEPCVSNPKPSFLITSPRGAVRRRHRGAVRWRSTARGRDGRRRWPGRPDALQRHGRRSSYVCQTPLVLSLSARARVCLTPQRHTHTRATTCGAGCNDCHGGRRARCTRPACE